MQPMNMSSSSSYPNSQHFLLHDLRVDCINSSTASHADNSSPYAEINKCIVEKRKDVDLCGQTHNIVSRLMRKQFYVFMYDKSSKIIRHMSNDFRKEEEQIVERERNVKEFD